MQLQMRASAQLANDLIIFKYRRAKLLRAEIDKIQRELKPLEEAIYAYMGKDELLNEVGHILIERKTYTQNRFDSVAFKAAYNDAYEEFKKPVETTRYIWK